MSQADVEGDREKAPAAPLWVKVFGVIVIVLILLVSILHLAGHGPMDHMSHMHQGAPQR